MTREPRCVGPDRLGIREIGETIAAELDIDARFETRGDGEPGGYLADNSKARRVLGTPEPVCVPGGAGKDPRIVSDEPLVSVLTATYNQADLIEETLESALGQTYERPRGDRRGRSLDRLDPRDRPRIRAAPPRSRQAGGGEERSGPCRRRNDALAQADGSLIAWLDGDDIWLPEKTAKQVEVMRRNPDVGMVHSGFEKFDSETGEIVPGGVTSVPAGDLLVPLFAQENFIGSLTAMFRRSALDARGGRLRDVEFAYGDDYWAWLSIALDWRIAGVDEVLARYRMHGTNLSFRQGNHLLKRIALLNDFLDEFPEAAEKLGPWRRAGMGHQYYEAAAWEREHGSRLAALRYWLGGFARAPGTVLRPAWNRFLGFGGGLLRRVGLR